MMSRICRHIVFQGHVQGVGFRYKVNELARGYPIQGYVKNLPTGDVELQVQGKEEDVCEFLERVRQAMAQHVERMHVQEGPPVMDQAGFEIRFS